MRKLFVFYIVALVMTFYIPSFGQEPVTGLKDIFFDQGEFRLREDANPVLKENAEILMKNPEMHAVIEGYCDNKEYASYSSLGQERAEVAMNYLIAVGVESHRISLMSKCSYDNGMKDFLGNLDAEWQFNSRVHFIGIKKEVDGIGLKTTNK